MVVHVGRLQIKNSRSIIRMCIVFELKVWGECKTDSGTGERRYSPIYPIDVWGSCMRIHAFSALCLPTLTLEEK